MSYGPVYVDHHKLIKSENLPFTPIEDWNKVDKPGFYRTDVGGLGSPDDTKSFVGIAISFNSTSDRIFYILLAETNNRDKQYMSIYGNEKHIWTPIAYDIDNSCAYPDHKMHFNIK